MRRLSRRLPGWEMLFRKEEHNRYCNEGDYLLEDNMSDDVRIVNLWL